MTASVHPTLAIEPEDSAAEAPPAVGERTIDRIPDAVVKQIHENLTPPEHDTSEPGASGPSS